MATASDPPATPTPPAAPAPPPRPAYRLRALRHALYRAYYRLKFFPFAKERRQRRRVEDRRRGFVVIQLDALASDDLERAFRHGYAPHLKRLVERSGWDLRRFPAGLPSATPAAQAAIFHGTKDRIPGFRFYEKGDGRVLIGSKPEAMQYIRDRLPHQGVLSGGSSYVNLYDGGADRAVFTLAVRQRETLFRKMGGGRLFLLLLLHPIRVLRMVLASVWEYFREERDRLLSQMRGESTYYWWYLPFLHIGTHVVLRELQTLAVLLDIYTGVPAIYTTYNVYDEFAHHFGPSSRTALKSIRALDRRVGEILRMLRRLPGREYDLFVLSDHGQTPSVPYRIAFGETLGRTVETAAQLGVTVLAGTGDYAPPRDALDFLLRELEEVATGSSLPARRVGLRLSRWIRRHYSLFPLMAEVVRVAEDRKLVVTYSSSLAHVYWTEPNRPLTLDEIRNDPERRALYYFLVAHRGIGVVITRLLDGAHVEGRDGRALVTPEGELEVLEGSDPLKDYGSTVVERRSVAWLAGLPNSGDLVLFGAYDPTADRCICFDDQVGAHGALGGRQFWPFIISPPGAIPEHHVIEDPLDLHTIFRRYPMTVRPEDPGDYRGIERRRDAS